MLATSNVNRLHEIFLVISLSALIIRCSGLEDPASMYSKNDRDRDEPTSDEALSRSKRYLLWNPLSVCQITVALAVPFKEVMEKSKNVGLAFDIQGNYPLPTQVVQLEPGYIPVAPGSRRVTRDLSLLDAYKNFEEILYTQGFHGRQCLLQAICMAAEIPMSKDNFFEEIVHMLLKEWGRGIYCVAYGLCNVVYTTTSYLGGNSSTFHDPQHPSCASRPSEIEPDITETYREAQKLGDSGVDCREAFPKCQTPILDVISMIWHPSSQTNGEP